MHRTISSFALLAMSTSLVGCGGRGPQPLPPPKAATGCMAPSTVKAATQQSALKPPSLGGLKPGHGAAPSNVEGLLRWRGQPTQDHWKALPDEAGAVLMSKAASPDGEIAFRARAFAGLAARGHTGGEQPMLVVLKTPDADATLRRAAIRALAEGYLAAELEGDEEGSVLPALLKALDGKEALEREATVKALAPFTSNGVIKAALAERLKAEDSEVVKEALEAALR